MTATPSADLSLQLHKMISRLGREGGDPEEMSTLGEVAARLQLMERALRDLLMLMEDTPYPEIHPSVEYARRLIDGQ